MTLILLVAFLGAVVGWVFAEPLSSLAVSENQPGVQAMAAGQLVWLAPAIILLAFSETLNSVLASYHRVVLQAFARLLGLLSTLLVLASFAGVLETRALPLSVIAGQATIALAQIVALRREGLTFRSAWPANLGKRFLMVSGALLATYAASQAYSILEKNTLTSFSAGLVSSFQYSVALTNVLITLAGVTLSNVLWPRFLDYAAEEDRGRLYDDVSVIVRFILLSIGCLCALVWINAGSVIELIYARGAFDTSAVTRTSDVLRMTVFAAVPVSGAMLIGRAMISLGAARSVMVVGVATSLAGCSVLIVARLLANPTLALSHWLIANLVGVVTYVILLARACSIHQLGYGRGIWWMTRWAAVLFSAGLLSETIPKTGQGMLALAGDIIMRSAAFTIVFVVLAWFAGMFRGLPPIWKRSSV